MPRSEPNNNVQAPTLSAAVTFKHVTVKLGGVLILDNIFASVPRGGCAAIVGPNGAGKTTMLMALLGQAPYSGNILIAAASGGRSPRIGYVPQRLQFDRGLPMTVMDFLAMGIQRLPLWLGVRASPRDKARALLSAVRAEALERRMIGALSGGEFQRVLLALALEQEPDLLVLDEPAAGVDVQGEYLLCELLERLRLERGFTQLMVSHDLATVTHHATHVILLNRRVASEGPPREVLTPENLSVVFGLHMGLADAHAMPDKKTACSASCCREDEHHD